MEEFEMLPNDETIEKMNAEYNRVLPKTKENSDAETADRLFAAYARTADILFLLNKLRGGNVRRLSEIKEKNLNILADLYKKYAGEFPSYTPYLRAGNIKRLQAELLLAESGALDVLPHELVMSELIFASVIN